MVYKSNRLHSYSVNPLIYIRASQNLVAMAMIIHDNELRKTAIFEKTFFDKPFKIIEHLTDAISWSHIELKQYKIVDKDIREP